MLSTGTQEAAPGKRRIRFTGLWYFTHNFATIKKSRVISIRGRGSAVAPSLLDTAIDRIYTAASLFPDPSFPRDVLAALLAPAEVLLWKGHRDARFENADPLHRLSACVVRDSAREIFLGAVRPADSPGFARSEIGLFASLVPHLRRAMRIRGEIARAEMRWRLASGLLDRLNSAVMILDALGQVLFANLRANEVLASGEALAVEAGRLRTVTDDQREELDRALTRAMMPGDEHGGPRSTLLPIRRHGLTPLVALTLPPRACFGWINELIPAAVVLVTDPERDETPEAVLTRLYGLTRAEASMLTALLSGRGLQQAAARLRISPNTAKTHVARVLAKTEAGGQGGLLRLVHTGPGLVRWD